MLPPACHFPNEYDSDDGEQRQSQHSDETASDLVTSRPTMIRVLKSLFSDRPPVIYFESYLEQRSDLSRVSSAHCKKVFFYHGQKVHRYNCVISTLKHAGLTESKTCNKVSLFWNDHQKPEMMKEMCAKFNHFPGSWHLGRKDLLWTHLSNMKRSHPEEYNFMPETYLDMEKCAQKRENGSIWISKPPNGSCGRGICVFKSNSKFQPPKGSIVQRYIDNPLLIEGRKFDLRIYVLVTSFDPLKIYVYEDGLVRRATELYDLSKSMLNQQCVHLTNYSVNKKSEKYLKNKENTEENKSSKWSLKELRTYLLAKGINFENIFNEIKALAVKTIISADHVLTSYLHQSADCRKTPPFNHIFEIFGLDVIIDKNLKPWLLEVNVEPSLSSSSPFDKRIKTALIADALLCSGIRLPGKKPRKDIHTSERNLVKLQRNGVAGFKCHEWEVIKETIDEWSRCGQWTPVFPTTNLAVNNLLTSKRYNNEILRLWIEHGQINPVI